MDAGIDVQRTMYGPAVQGSGSRSKEWTVMDAGIDVQRTVYGPAVQGSGGRSKERRGKLEIFVDILNVCKEGALKTEIVYRANLNFNRVNHYIPFLEKRQLLVNTGPTYTTTEKGKEFLDNYYQVKGLFLT